jgi:hypothetical protein
VPAGVVGCWGVGPPLAVVVMCASACAVPADGDDDAHQTSAEACVVEGVALDLGAHALDVVPTEHVTVSGGRYRLTATGFLHDGAFDPEVGRTRVVWGPESAPPEYDAGPATVSGAGGSVDLVEDSPEVVELQRGTWWFLNSNGVRLTIEPCAPATGELVEER